eukprot:GDKK01068032.1.p1 GENE.GDKK01068032.1~~GDKK01068032.1.p1  ORF type:complete len:257 (-),score=44.47 GDKK01068032.1:67-837(-)
MGRDRGLDRSHRDSDRREPARRDSRDRRDDRGRGYERDGRDRNDSRDKREHRDSSRDRRDDRRDGRRDALAGSRINDSRTITTETRAVRETHEDHDRDDRMIREARRSPVRAREETAPIVSAKPVQTTAKDRALSKAALEQAKKERIALLKNITGGDVSEDDDKPREKRARRERTEGEQGGEGLEGGENEEMSEEDDEEDMMEMLGFGGFGSTKGKHVAENSMGAAAGAVAKHHKRQYRQYMNRKGGFNRPLQKID